MKNHTSFNRIGKVDALMLFPYYLFYLGCHRSYYRRFNVMVYCPHTSSNLFNFDSSNVRGFNYVVGGCVHHCGTPITLNCRFTFFLRDNKRLRGKTNKQTNTSSS